MGELDRIKPWKIRRIYRLSLESLDDDNLLLDVGWDLQARCEKVREVCLAVRGVLPCPRCRQQVYRARYHQAQPVMAYTFDPAFACSSCGRQATWRDRREALRSYPICLDCGEKLRWEYASEVLECGRCMTRLTWREYRRRIRTRTKLPCISCGNSMARPKVPKPPADMPALCKPAPELFRCPQCGKDGVHETGLFRCLACGHSKHWQTYRERMKRRVERLSCSACGLAFTWQSWRKANQGHDLLMGNLPAVERFLDQWPCSRSAAEQITQIDLLLHALHARGSIGPTFIAGDHASVKRLLDEIAGNV